MAAKSDKEQLEEMVESEQIILKAFDDIGVERPDDVLLLTDDEIENKMGLKPAHIKKLKAVIAEYKKWKEDAVYIVSVCFRVWSLRSRLRLDAPPPKDGPKKHDKDKPKK
mmetsp:Transcript_6472/g.15163  ORF Transcript_6472/g.15163 Transcript_6472/m.15163 type:complete len:110 (+) Transcript_6472:317-646(+)